jgi:hypothetical protein
MLCSGATPVRNQRPPEAFALAAAAITRDVELLQRLGGVVTIPGRKWRRDVVTRFTQHGDIER